MTDRDHGAAEAPLQVRLTLNASGVAAPAQRTVALVSQVVGTCLRALANDDLTEPRMQAEFTGYQFQGLELGLEERRTAYQNWVLGNGFQDLARGVRETLEEAWFYLGMIRREPGLTSVQALEEEMTALRVAAQTYPFPKLLGRINAELTQPMAFEAEFLSLQKARNCLEHRGGRVSAKDVDPETQKLCLSFPRLKTFYLRGDEEIEIAAGEIIDTHSPDNPFGNGEEVSIYIRRVTRTREYALNEPVIITAADFYEIAMACHIFAADLTAKLPHLPTAQSTEEV